MKRPYIWLVPILFLYSYTTSVYTGGPPGADAEVVTIKSPADINSKQKTPYFIGISADTAGAKVISMRLVIIPPRGTAKPHYHDGFEEAVYLIRGMVETRYGKKLEKSVINEAGDFIFIPSNVPHQPHNLSDTEPAIAIISRNDPNEQEQLVPYDPSPDEYTKKQGSRFLQKWISAETSLFSLKFRE
ncbi:MAG: cupin domain-containing protein [Gammaproteobacteria bacterium]|nr:cupin domain-containing protein [Gammaproteobacteria bacterium]